MSEISISLLSPVREHEYDVFLNEHKAALFYHSLKYRDFLRSILETSQDIYLIAHQDSQIVGVLPAFIKRHHDGSSVINSLPFFGSHGGILTSPNVSNQSNVKELLMKKLCEIGQQENSISLTIIDNPREAESGFYKSYFQMEASDQRISQITDICGDGVENVGDELMKRFHHKTRNMVRKGMKGGFSVFRDESLPGLKVLYRLHSENMKAINGKEKPLFVFEVIHKVFEADKHYRLYFAEKNGEIAAALLLFYYKNYCEYFTPAINQKFRSEQPLSTLIFHAMQEASLRGCQYWNWGGTWLSQDGVYLFKKRWGAEEKIYHYFSQILTDKVWDYSQDKLMKQFGYYYTLPILKIQSKNDQKSF